MKISEEPSIPYLIEISKRLLAYMEQKKIRTVSGRGQRKSEWQKAYELVRAYAAKLLEYTVQYDMLDGRNSCSKTDVDATMMHMKYDHYCHTNAFKPGYNVQMGLSSGLVTDLYISSDCNDQPTYILFMQRYHDDYGFYPKLTIADAGYGSYDSCMFNKEKGIHQYLKFAGMEAEKKRVTDKNRYRACSMRQPDGSYVCPEGHKFEKVSERTETRGIYDRLTEKLENSHSGQCPSKQKCTKAKGNRQISVKPALRSSRMK